MTDLRLEIDEEVILQSSNVKRCGTKEIKLDELVLTNRNVICVYSKNDEVFLRPETIVEKIPLSKICIVEGKGQARVFDDPDYGMGLQVSFEAGQREHFVFCDKKRELPRWEAKMCSLLKKETSAQNLHREESIVEEELEPEDIEKESSCINSSENKSIIDKTKDAVMIYWNKADLFCKVETVSGFIAVILLAISILTARVLPIIFSCLQFVGLTMAFLIHKGTVKTEKYWMKYLALILSIFLIVINILSYSWGKHSSDKQAKVAFIPLTIENFSFEIPSYWEKDKKTKDSIRYYAETDGKVAMLTISYSVDDEDPVTWQMLYDERELMIDAIESSMSSMDCKVSGYEEFVSDYGEKGLLYKYTLNISVDNSRLSGEGCWYCIPSEEDNRWFFINYGITENVEYKNYAADFMSLIASAKCNYASSNKDTVAEKSEIVVTMSEDDLIGLKTAEAQSKLKEMGFSKFEYETLETDKNADLNGKIGAIEIKNWKFGKGDFSKGDTYKTDAIVVLWSYVYEESEKTRPIFYSTKDRETAKKGNSGVFSYKNKGGSYDIYWIVDFDEGYVYQFTEGNGESTCDKVKIVSGDLNDKITVTWHGGGEQWSWGLHFKHVNHPETLVVCSNRKA